jgi:hypothetical protein
VIQPIVFSTVETLHGSATEDMVRTFADLSSIMISVGAGLLIGYKNHQHISKMECIYTL